MKINQTAILNATLEVLNEGGIEALSMRTVAGRLDVKAASLYFHVKNKQELLQLVAQHIADKAALRMAADDTVTIQRMMVLFREELLAVRDSPLIFKITDPNQFAQESVTRFLKLIQDQGVPKHFVGTAAHLLINFVLWEVADQQGTLQASETAPASQWPAAVPQPDAEQGFEFDLQVIMLGLTHLTDAGIG